MIITANLIILAVALVASAESFKRFGYYNTTLFFRIITILYATTMVVTNQLLPQELPIPFVALPIFVLVSIYSWVLYIIELFTPQKIYKSFLDVPHQVMYKIGSHGRGIVLTEKQAKKAHKNGETVYIHAIARVVYKPKDEESHTPGVDQGISQDRTTMRNMNNIHVQQPEFSEDFLKKFKELQARLNKQTRI